VKRILIVSNYGWTLFNFRRRLIDTLLNESLDVWIQTEFDGYESRLGLPPTRTLPLDIDRKGVSPFRDVCTVGSVLRAIRTVNADVCLLYTIKPIVYGGVACRIARIPYVANVTGLGTAFIGKRWIRWIAILLYRTGLRSASRVFFQNKVDMALFLEHGMARPEQSSLLPGSGIDLDRFSVAPYPDSQDMSFLLIARMLRDKGVGEFVEAARIVRTTFPQTRFQLLGPVDAVNRTAVSRDTINSWVREGIVEYLGETDDVRPFIAAAHCIVLPSYREGTPRSLLEAAAMGRPVIATDAVGCRDVVDDGSTGFLCKVADAEDLARSMVAMLALSVKDRAEMGLKGRTRVERVYDERIVINEYLQLVRSLVQR
jgi:glycosyltransferase involved in cell wall biosynthesis